MDRVGCTCWKTGPCHGYSLPHRAAPQDCDGDTRDQGAGTAHRHGNQASPGAMPHTRLKTRALPHASGRTALQRDIATCGSVTIESLLIFPRMLFFPPTRSDFMRDMCHVLGAPAKTDKTMGCAGASAVPVPAGVPDRVSAQHDAAILPTDAAILPTELLPSPTVPWCGLRALYAAIHRLFQRRAHKPVPRLHRNAR